MMNTKFTDKKNLENRMGELTGSSLQNFYRYIRIVGADLCVCPNSPIQQGY